MSRDLANQDIRLQAASEGLFLWEVAEAAGISPNTLTMWLRRPLSKEDPRRERIMQALGQMAGAASNENHL